jgi:thiamine kinase-like enzyme
MQQVRSVDERTRIAVDALGAKRGVPLTVTRMSPSIAMPLHLGLDAAPCVVAPAGGEEPIGFLKVYETEAEPFLDFAATIAASLQAAELQLAPALLDIDESSRALLYAWLAPADWRMALRQDLDDENVLVSVIAAKRAWHQSRKLAQHRAPFETISSYLGVMDNIRLPDGERLSELRIVRELRPWIGRLEAAFVAAGTGSGPIHGENTLSNIMLGSAGRVQLVDFDRAVNADPHYDVAGLCLEVCSFKDEVDRIVELYLGAPGAAVSARVCLYMIVDDFLWGCWAAINHFSSARSGSVEFYKYAQNRFLRCRYWLSRWDADALARQM